MAKQRVVDFGNDRQRADLFVGETLLDIQHRARRHPELGEPRDPLRGGARGELLFDLNGQLGAMPQPLLAIRETRVAHQLGRAQSVAQPGGTSSDRRPG